MKCLVRNSATQLHVHASDSRFPVISSEVEHLLQGYNAGVPDAGSGSSLDPIVGNDDVAQEVVVLDTL